MVSASPQDKRPVLAVVPSPAVPCHPGGKEGLGACKCYQTPLKFQVSESSLRSFGSSTLWQPRCSVQKSYSEILCTLHSIKSNQCVGNLMNGHWLPGGINMILIEDLCTISKNNENILGLKPPMLHNLMFCNVLQCFTITPAVNECNNEYQIKVACVIWGKK